MLLTLWGIIIVLSVVLDQVTKWLVVNDLKPIGFHVLVDKVFQLRYVENRGAAFGMLQGQRWFFIILSTIAIAAILVGLVVYRKRISPLLGISLAMIAGGGIGNQIDRIVNGYVVDFLEVLFVEFAVFNVADCFVTIGSFLAVIDVLFFDKYLLLDEKKTIPEKDTDGVKKP